LRHSPVDPDSADCVVFARWASHTGPSSVGCAVGLLQILRNFEPLRQIVDGVRAILYFDARGGAGLTRAWIASGLGLVFWMGLGILVTTWYDRKRLYRMPPDLMEYIDRAVLAYRKETRESSGRGYFRTTGLSCQAFWRYRRC
jgi:hypothetical protein